MKVVGIDLSGPSNIADTYLVVLEEQGAELKFINVVEGADDQRIFRTISDLGKNDRIVIGMDAPLSYNPGGGDRASDRELRQLVLKKGSVGIMPPTMMRIVYLTLRALYWPVCWKPSNRISTFASSKCTRAHPCSCAMRPPTKWRISNAKGRRVPDFFNGLKHRD